MIAHKLATMMNEILQLYSIVDVRKLVNNAPPMFPAFPDEQNNPMSVPLPRLPNQFPNIAEHAGHPIDYIAPLTANKKQNRYIFVKPYSAAKPIKLTTIVTTK